MNIWGKERMDIHRETRVGIEAVSDKQLELEASERATHQEGVEVE